VQTNASKSALRVLMAELARAHQALERGALDVARESIEAALAIDPQNVRALQLREQIAHAATAPAADVPRTPPPSAARERPAAWSAFEKRVRDRRAERCIVIAREALSRGDVVAAREVTDELASLMPEHPALGELRTLVEPRTEGRRPTAEPAATPPPPPAVEPPRVAVAPPMVPRTAAAPVVERATRPRQPPVARREPLHARQPLPDLNTFASERTLERKAPPAPVRESPGYRRHAAVLVAAAAVLLLGVLLPVEWGRRADPVESVADRDPASESTASLDDAAGPETVAGPDDESMSPAEPHEPPSSGPALPAQAEGLNADASTGSAAPAQTGSSAEAISTSGASEEPARVEPVAEELDREAEAQRAAYAARELARAEAAQRAVLSRPEPASPAPAPAPPERERAEPAETGTLARLGTTQSATLRTPPSPASPQPSAAAPAYVPSPSSRPADAAAMAAEPPGDAAVRDVLQRYVTAYNRLDAVAAREVWPTVDQSALERAFAQLDSQMLRFDRCDVDVDDEGGIATCAGQARWVPRVGTRDPKREARTWRFELARNGDDWIITRAEARR
jgi:hypothetical protein